jgi:hypothetical protein
MCRKYTSLGAKELRPENDNSRCNQFVTFRVSWPLGVPFPCRPCERHMPIHPRGTPTERMFGEIIGRNIVYPSATYDKS